MPRSRPDPDAMRPSLCMEGLGFGHGDLRLFDGLTLDFPPGLSVVIGGDGRGKTTLIALLAGALMPQAGECIAGGIRLSQDPTGYRAQVVRAADQTDGLASLPAGDWLAVVARTRPGFDAGLQDTLIEGLQLGPHLHKTDEMLSTGTRRKVQITAALAAGAPVTLLDDPFAALDAGSTRFLTEALRRLGARRERVLVLACHAPVAGLADPPVLDLGD